ncbi:dTDP-4-dehydrorhamnose 3,5-epimerase [Hymenobacter busanensis]|uniref:dTDP-4-dehydrorhamnose 3,5-epimerase n=1 Tax=Hymenobacter busanensis TaxID=2607656 RepID=A0A7L4ZY62_9BACT|nr:dTDP-4-dehydrorhamnose 3,5-epimerase [Hymenobacter busanensis]KAA9333444.1 dTDP-4-dehydrorhamnose 3,5-epimerase [Hymenobacter busanensis]QHJ07873.1 dTDP-4-dehydrorhamnose 3,5-epimerase [Hymenobacter busanensis]
MEVKKHALAGVVEVFPRIFSDARGAFFEPFNAQRFVEEAGIDENWIQDNHSISSKGVLRGLHFQRPPYAQAKLVRVANGRSLDVIVDIRRNSPTYGQHLKVILDAERFNLLYVPVGFAHGFLALEDNNVFLYKCSNYYHPASEGGLHWNDPALGIDWGITAPNVSAKDDILPRLADLDSPF